MDKGAIVPQKPRDVQQWLPIAIKLITVIGYIVTLITLLIVWRKGYFQDIESLQRLIKSFSWGAPLVFVLLQLTQVVVPIVPGGLTMVSGVLLFGPWFGLLYNYIGITAGSIVAFLLAGRYGEPLVRRIIGDRMFDRFATKINTQGYKRFFAIAILMPVAPDDALCYLTGLSKMKLSTFVKIILTCKPLTIAAYSFLTLEVGKVLANFL